MKIYTDLDLINNNPTMPWVVMLYPFLGVYPEPLHYDVSVMRNRFDEYCKTCDFLSLSCAATSDVFVFPFEWYMFKSHVNREEILDNFITTAKKYHKKVVLFAYGDDFVDLPQYENLVIFQSNLTANDRRENHFAMPSFVEDLYSIYMKNYAKRSRLWLRGIKKDVSPIVSFCGYARSAQERIKALTLLNESRYIKTKFILRDKYFGGAWDKKSQSYLFAKLKKIRREYVSNIASGDYVLCVRGYGNYSARFYEALCCGKIPLFIDTNCVMPLQDKVNYLDKILYVNYTEIQSVGSVVSFYDKSIKNSEFYDMQTQCRLLWRDYLSPTGFFKNIIDMF